MGEFWNKRKVNMTTNNSELPENWEIKFDQFINSLINWKTENIQSKSDMFQFILRIKEWFASEFYLERQKVISEVLDKVIGEDEDYMNPEYNLQMEEVVGRNELRAEQRAALVELEKA